MKEKEAFRLFLIVLKPYWKRYIFIAVILSISVALGLSVPLLNKNLLDNGFIKADFKVIIITVIAMFVINLVISATALFIEKRRISFAADFRLQLEKTAVLHLSRIKASYFNMVNQAELLNRIDVDVNYLGSVVNAGTFYIFSNIITLIGSLISVLFINRWLFLILVIVLPFKYFIVHVFSKLQKERLQKFMAANTKYAKWFSEYVTGILNIRLFGLIDYKMDEFNKKEEDKLNSVKKLEIVSQYRATTDTFFNGILTLIVFIIGGYLVITSRLSIGSMYAFSSYMSMIIGLFSSLMNIKVIYTNIVPPAVRFFEFLDIDVEEENSQKNLVSDESNITYEDVSFSYGSGSESEIKEVLKNFNLKIENRSKVALLGMNGSGKTTVIHLLLKVYNCDSGTVKYNGIDIKALGIKKYRDLFSVVSQNIYLFDDSIRYNICLGKLINDNEFQKILFDCDLEDVVKEKGLDYKVGVNGANLSGGQKQKIALARALVHNRPVFIFDEATSNTDIMFERKFHNLLFEQLKDKTVIIITHKVEILKQLDCIYMIEEGRNIAQGSYDILMGNFKFRNLIDEFKRVEKNEEKGND
jgi:ATP-binding cassette subfamily B protein/subfamily B ATP-binding cassette protein MsbA